jgi:hypothetical protein
MKQTGSKQLSCIIESTLHDNFTAVTCLATTQSYTIPLRDFRSNTQPQTKPLASNMATNDNNIQSIEKRYRAAMNGTNKNKTVQELKELLLEDQLPISHRLIAHAALARGVDGWFQREEHHLAAEQVYSEISAEVVSTSEGHEIGKRNFGPIRAHSCEAG